VILHDGISDRTQEIGRRAFEDVRFGSFGVDFQQPDGLPIEANPGLIDRHYRHINASSAFRNGCTRFVKPFSAMPMILLSSVDM
jgi:hypothetical protein